MESDQGDQPLMTPTGLGDHLGGISVKTIYHWRAMGVGPKGIRIGKHLRFRKTDVDSWLEEQSELTAEVA